MRVAYVLGTSAGGTIRHVRMLAEGLAARGVTVSVYGPAQTWTWDVSGSAAATPAGAPAEAAGTRAGASAEARAGTVSGLSPGAGAENPAGAPAETADRGDRALAEAAGTGPALPRKRGRAPCPGFPRERGQRSGRRSRRDGRYRGRRFRGGAGWHRVRDCPGRGARGCGPHSR